MRIRRLGHDSSSITSDNSNVGFALKQRLHRQHEGDETQILRAAFEKLGGLLSPGQRVQDDVPAEQPSASQGHSPTPTRTKSKKEEKNPTPFATALPIPQTAEEVRKIDSVKKIWDQLPTDDHTLILDILTHTPTSATTSMTPYQLTPDYNNPVNIGNLASWVNQTLDIKKVEVASYQFSKNCAVNVVEIFTITLANDETLKVYRVVYQQPIKPVTIRASNLFSPDGLVQVILEDSEPTITALFHVDASLTPSIVYWEVTQYTPGSKSVGTKFTFRPPGKPAVENKPSYINPLTSYYKNASTELASTEQGKTKTQAPLKSKTTATNGTFPIPEDSNTFLLPNFKTMLNMWEALPISHQDLVDDILKNQCQAVANDNADATSEIIATDFQLTPTLANDADVTKKLALFNNKALPLSRLEETRLSFSQKFPVNDITIIRVFPLDGSAPFEVYNFTCKPCGTEPSSYACTDPLPKWDPTAADFFVNFATIVFSRLESKNEVIWQNLDNKQTFAAQRSNSNGDLTRSEYDPETNQTTSTPLQSWENPLNLYQDTSAIATAPKTTFHDVAQSELADLYPEAAQPEILNQIYLEFKNTAKNAQPGWVRDGKSFGSVFLNAKAKFEDGYSRFVLTEAGQKKPSYVVTVSYTDDGSKTLSINQCDPKTGNEIVKILWLLPNDSEKDLIAGVGETQIVRNPQTQKWKGIIRDKNANANADQPDVVFHIIEPDGIAKTVGSYGWAVPTTDSDRDEVQPWLEHAFTASPELRSAQVFAAKQTTSVSKYALNLKLGIGPTFGNLKLSDGNFDFSNPESEYSGQGLGGNLYSLQVNRDWTSHLSLTAAWTINMSWNHYATEQTDLWSFALHPFVLGLYLTGENIGSSQHPLTVGIGPNLSPLNLQSNSGKLELANGLVMTNPESHLRATRPSFPVSVFASWRGFALTGTYFFGTPDVYQDWPLVTSAKNSGLDITISKCFF